MDSPARDQHLQQLKDRCRVCAKVDDGKGFADIQPHAAALKGLFDISVDNEDLYVFPKRICRAHVNLCKRYTNATNAGKTYNCKVQLQSFVPHGETCEFCKPQGSKKRGHEVLKDAGEKEPIPQWQKLLKTFQELKADDRRIFVKALVEVLGEGEKEDLAYWVGLAESTALKRDAQTIVGKYKSCGDLLSVDVNEWLQERNRILIKFFIGITGQGIHFEQGKNAFKLGVLVEILYSFLNQRLVGPLSFVINLAIYTKTGSRYATEVLSSISPSGSYSTTLDVLKSMGQGASVPYPEGDLINVFDNEQVIGRKRGVKPANKAHTSVITNKAYVQLSPECTISLQTQRHLKPKNWFNLGQFENPDVDGKGDNDMEGKKQQFVTGIYAIRDQNSKDFEYMEGVHFKHLCQFIEEALEDVKTEHQKEVNDIDAIVTERQRNRDTVVCDTCGTTNNRRKQVCEGCKGREGIKSAKQHQKEPTTSTRTKPEQSAGKSFVRYDLIGDTVHHKSNLQQQNEKFSHIEHGHTSVKEVVITDPVFCNPNSYESVANVLRKIGQENNVESCGGTARQWTVVCCDGAPYFLAIKLIKEAVVCQVDLCGRAFLKPEEYRRHHSECHSERKMCSRPEFDWVYLMTGLGHYEVNLMRSFFELNWTPFLEVLCEEMSFTSPAAKNVAQRCKDHHLTWQLIDILHKGTLREMVLPYVRSLVQGQEPTVRGYFRFYEEKLHADPTYKYMFEQICRYCSAIVMFRMAVRRNNNDLLQSSRYMSKELFHGRCHPKYQQIELHEAVQNCFLEQPVRDKIFGNTSIITNKYLSGGEGLDYKLEAKNRDVKRIVPKGTIPSDQMWLAVCRNEKKLRQIHEKLDSSLGLSHDPEISSSAPPTDAVQHWRVVLRERKYLFGDKNELLALSGKPLHPNLTDFTTIATIKRTFRIQTQILNEKVKASNTINQPVYITQEEEDSYNKVENLPKTRLLENMSELLDKMDDTEVMQSFLQKFLRVKKLNKGACIDLYNEMTSYFVDGTDEGVE